MKVANCMLQHYAYAPTDSTNVSLTLHLIHAHYTLREQAAKAPTLCAAGSYASANSTSVCTACPAGYACTTGTVLPVACLVGTSSAASASSCTACPGGYYCSGNATTTAVSNSTRMLYLALR
eukprot:21268-Heterococcus_DN1.PRE.4